MDFGTKLHPMWKMGATRRAYRHECGAVVELEWLQGVQAAEIGSGAKTFAESVKTGRVGELSIRWGSGFLRRRFYTVSGTITDPGARSWWESKIIRQLTEEMLLEIKRSRG